MLKLGCTVRQFVSVLLAVAQQATALLSPVTLVTLLLAREKLKTPVPLVTRVGPPELGTTEAFTRMR